MCIRDSYGAVGDVNDVLDAGSGADEMRGGQGNDTYYVDNPDDQTIELADEGIDHVNASVSHTLQSNIENGALIPEAGAAALTGNELNNSLHGNDAANILTGGAGRDMLLGNGGADTLIGADDSEQDLLSGGAGRDTYYAGDGDVLQDSDLSGIVYFDGHRLQGGEYVGLAMGKSAMSTPQRSLLISTTQPRAT